MWATGGAVQAVRGRPATTCGGGSPEKGEPELPGTILRTVRLNVKRRRRGTHWGT
jgi:hypothetical protein